MRLQLPHLRCNPFFEIEICEIWICECNILHKNTNKLGPAWQNIVGKHHIHGQKKIAFSYSDPGGTLEKILNNLKPLFSCKKSFTFQKRSKKMLLH